MRSPGSCRTRSSKSTPTRVARLTSKGVSDTERVGARYGAGTRTRTADLRFTKPLLYQLSYAGTGGHYSGGRCHISPLLSLRLARFRRDNASHGRPRVQWCSTRSESWDSPRYGPQRPGEGSRVRPVANRFSKRHLTTGAFPRARVTCRSMEAPVRHGRLVFSCGRERADHSARTPCVCCHQRRMAVMVTPSRYRKPAALGS